MCIRDSTRAVHEEGVVRFMAFGEEPLAEDTESVRCVLHEPVERAHSTVTSDVSLRVHVTRPVDGACQVGGAIARMSVDAGYDLKHRVVFEDGADGELGGTCVEVFVHTHALAPEGAATVHAVCVME